jgi:branched-chain amino acid transport system ATP-binding protein
VAEVAAVSGAAPTPPPAGEPPLIHTVGLTKTFGGLEAVRSVDFSLGRGEIRAIIGPNGAGKTTLVGMISGRISPTAGTVLFEGRDITRMPAHDRAVMGIAYTFQTTSIYPRLTVFENVALAAQRRMARGVRSRLAMDQATLAGRVDAALTHVGLRESHSLTAGSLPHGHQRLLEVAMALALEPTVLIMDEPTQGLSPEEITGVTTLLRAISRNATILLIEHNMRVVLDLSRRITVMDRGTIIAEGTPQEIEADSEVQRVYLGGG